jgi:hypothetical protein
MDISKVVAVLETPDEDVIRALLDDHATVFWIDWRQEDETIAESCESVLQSGHLSGEMVEVDTAEGFEVYVRYRDNRVRVPLSYSCADRHITLYALNQALAPEYEVRFCLDSHGSDTLAFIPLGCEQWAAFERQYGEAVGQRFYKLVERPNLFTDEFPPAVTWQQLAADPAQKLAAIKAYREEHGCGMGEAKKAVEAFIAASRGSA